MFGGTELMKVWEDGQELCSLKRSMLVVETWDDTDSGLQGSVEDLNRQVLRLRSRLFGRDIELYAECDECGEPLELTLDALRLASGEKPITDPPLVIDGHEMICRPPATSEVLTAARMPDPRRWLAELCVHPRAGAAGETLELSHEDVCRIEDWLRDRHPLLEVTLAIVCPGCSHEWQQLLDIDGLVWRDIDIEARRLLDDVDRLARRYGWDEADILAMRPQRRARYLELIQ